jgi:hypothetical protein
MVMSEVLSLISEITELRDSFYKHSGRISQKSTNDTRRMDGIEHRLRMIEEDLRLKSEAYKDIIYRLQQLTGYECEKSKMILEITKNKAEIERLRSANEELEKQTEKARRIYAALDDY